MIHKIELNGDTIHLNKSKWFGWSVVYPLKNEDGSWNYFNLITGGSIWKLIFVLVFMAIMFGAIMEYHSNMETCQEAVNIVNQYELWGALDFTYNFSLYDFNLTEVKNE
jgi:hypothetical protein